MTNSPEAIAAATEILEAAQKIPYQGTTHFIETRASIIQKHYAAKDAETPKTDEEVLLDGAGIMIEPPVVLASFARTLEQERDQLKARVAELEKALKRIVPDEMTFNSGFSCKEITELLGSSLSESLTRLQELERKAKALDWLLGFNTLSITKYIPPAKFSTQHFETLSAIESAMEKQK